jgi:hypothetical protein
MEMIEYDVEIAHGCRESFCFALFAVFKHNRQLVAHGKISLPGSMFSHHTDPIAL